MLPREKPDAVLATVVFRAEASLRVGQRLVVAGNCPELGYWRPKDSAATMAWSEGDRWTAAVKFDAFAVFGAVDATSAAGWLDFKLVIVDDARDGAETWLDGDNFRVRRLPGPTPSPRSTTGSPASTTRRRWARPPRTAPARRTCPAPTPTRRARAGTGRAPFPWRSSARGAR